MKDQTWSGLPIGTTDYTVIRHANFKNPIHALVVNTNNKKSITAESSANSNLVKFNSTSLDNSVSWRR